ncbi:MAG: hypothetical protein KA054_00655 [Candidatus Moranbacteria bacterium]|nr:hypothetical protein [Candidatus Moranbacteria bacterium]
MHNRQAMRRDLFVFDAGKYTYLASSLPGVTETIFSVLVSRNAEHSLFKEHHSNVSVELADRKKLPLDTCTIFRASTVHDRSFVTFIHRGQDNKTIELADTDDMKRWKSHRALDHFTQPPVFVDLPLLKRHRRIGAFVSIGRKHIGSFIGNKDFDDWEDQGTVLEGRSSSFDATHLEPIAVTSIPSGILLLYSAKNSENQLSVGAAIFDPNNLTLTRWRAPAPLWKAPHDWYGEPVTFLGASFQGKYGTLFLQRLGHTAESFPIPKLWEMYHLPKQLPTAKNTKKIADKKTVTALQLVRFHANPIIEPKETNTWEAMATFNAAAVTLEDRVHLLYRAQGHDGHSVLGYATCTDGIHIDERLDYPVYDPSRITGTPKTQDRKFVRHPYMSGGGTGGCEDPRLTRIDDTLYLTYTAFNGMQPPGVALTSISISDFLAKRFDRWKKPRLISRFGHIQKNWVIFPEKIGGKIAILHNVSPRIMIEPVDEINAPTLVIDSCPPRQADNAHRWDNIVRGAGAPPLRTEHGWLVLYHAMDAHDPNKYKVGAMLLDLQNPEIILARSPAPVLEPEEHYENEGYKWGVVFVCGAVIKNGTLFVYYGASDKTLAVATASLPSFLNDLLGNRTPQIKAVTIQR